ncbi:ABC transporter substrate-binding protein [Phocaeicola coprophilus]|uniref:ABC transporter substrate-binding protein n=1 Tax=Phocaeicola coprophilus TaxID=387090 RepID=UPI001D34C9DC|nr:ABC transporter substrate-binding protein [Phocaeicola coprophilus]HJE48066.1 ABC transporter substrate-binding protein [Phocaeicola coprophilus]
MKKILLSAYIVTWVLLLSACGGGSKTSSLQAEGDTVRMKYSSLLQIVKHADYTVVTIRNPWDTLKVLHTYLLADREKPLPEHLPEGTVVRTPLQKSVIYSSIHCSLWSELDELKGIGGVCGLEYIKLPQIQEGCRNGSIVNVGNSMNPDIERIIDLRPDAILLSPFENSGGYGRVGKLNIPIIECADYMETSALGRAEWMRLYGLLLGKEAQADSLFAGIEKEYLTLTQQVKSQNLKRPTVISEMKNSSAWYIPGGNSTMGRLYQDAGADYVFAYLSNSGSVPLAFETVFDRGGNADIWLIKYNQPQDKTYSELERDYAPYARFKAFQDRKVYGCNTNHVPFYEESPFHPELLLKDLIKIFHPELLPDYDLKYFSNLAE